MTQKHRHAAAPETGCATVRPTHALLWSLVGMASALYLTTGLFHEIAPPTVHAVLLAAPLVLFAFAHGSAIYGLRHILMFFAICMVVTNVIENCNILTGFPGGFYQYGESLGPKLFFVPLVIGPAYFGVGYLAWVLARLTLRDANQLLPAQSILKIPVFAAFAMVAFNISFEPAASTVHKAWIWRDGGSYFGVPISNFFSWYLTSYVFFQLYALYLHHMVTREVGAKSVSRQYSYQAVVLYGAIAAMAILRGLTTSTTETVADQAGTVWYIQDIFAVCALVCSFTMVPLTLLAWNSVAQVTSTNSR